MRLIPSFGRQRQRHGKNKRAKGANISSIEISSAISRKCSPCSNYL